MRHWRALDGLRGVAMLIVFIGHLRGTPARGGFIGVDVFFVLSGFLITGLLIREQDRHGTVSLRAFFLRRVLRLYPALLLLCVVAVPMAALSERYQVRATVLGLASALVYCFNLAGIFRDTPTLVGNLWSLSVEEQYYLLWAPAAAWLLARGRLTWQTLAALAVGGWAVLAATTAIWGRSGTGQAYFQLHGHLSELLLGGLLAWAVRNERLPRLVRSPLPALAAIAVLLTSARVIQRVDSPKMVLVYPLLALCSATLIGHLVSRQDSPIGRFLCHPLWVHLGVRSYAFYLFHRPVIHLVEEHLHSRLAVASVAMAISLALAEVSWRLVESPALARKDRFTRVPVAAA